MTDKNVEAVRELLLRRSEVGIKKYGVTTSDANLSLRDWLQHALLEGLDKCVYLQSAIANLDDVRRAIASPTPTPADHGPRMHKDEVGNYPKAMCDTSGVGE